MVNIKSNYSQLIEKDFKLRFKHITFKQKLKYGIYLIRRNDYKGAVNIYRCSVNVHRRNPVNSEPLLIVRKEWWETSSSPLEEQDSNNYDDDEHHGEHGAHDPKHLRLFYTALHTAFVRHHDEVRVRAGWEGPLQREREGERKFVLVQSNNIYNSYGWPGANKSLFGCDASLEIKIKKAKVSVSLLWHLADILAVLRTVSCGHYLYWL